MKRSFLIAVCGLYSLSMGAQTILNAKSPEEFRKLKNEHLRKEGDSLVSTLVKALPYGHIEDRDVIWSMDNYEIIDLNQKINQPLFRSREGFSPVKSLYQCLIDGINSGKITEVYSDEEFNTKITKEDIQRLIKREKVDDSLTDRLNAGEQITEEDRKANTDVFEIKSDKVRFLKIKGRWYIDRRLGEMRYRLLAIAPVGPDAQVMGESFADKDEVIDLFWVFYPDAREVLANEVVFNAKNTASNITFDDILNARRFSSVIYRTEGGQGGYGDRPLREYFKDDAKAQLEESEKIKQYILEVENDMWNY